MFSGLSCNQVPKGIKFHRAFVAVERILSLPNVAGVECSPSQRALQVHLIDGTARMFTARKSFTYAACKALAALAPDDT